jgi:orotate phosphoribosyltransferase
VATPNREPLSDDLLRLLAGRAGHFRLESGLHGDRWLDLDALFLRPRAVRPFAVALAQRLAGHGAEAVCGPLTGGAFVAQLVAEELDAEFYPVERAATYRLPAALRPRVRGKAVAVVDDVINAGSAVRGTVADLLACGARPVAVGALLTLGGGAATIAGELNVPLERVAHLDSGLWRPAACPLCAAGVPLEDLVAPRGRRLTLVPLPGAYAICRLGPDAPPPTWATRSGFWSVTRTADELSVVCPDADVPPGVRCERGWRGWRLAGTFDLGGETGVLAALLDPLAAAGVGVFAVSTFDTDYLWVAGANFDRAADVLRRNGHTVP